MNPETGFLLRTLTSHTSSVWSVAFSNTGLLASGSFDYSVKVWNPETGSLLHTLTSHTSYVESVAFSNTGLLASGSFDNSVKVWIRDNNMTYQRDKKPYL